MTQPAQPAPAQPPRPAQHDAHDARGRGLGFLQALLAYGLWGVLVLYFAVFGPASPLEVIGWRILLSVVVAGPALLATGRWGEFTALLRDRRALATFAVAGVLIAANWLSFVWAVSLGHGLEASLGYYINSLVAVLLGMLVLGERMRPLQWAAIGIACCAVAVLAVALGRIPWLGLAMATAFGLYGLVK
ncbi:Protein RarD [Pseudoclavibacter triregionum]|nr:Protein RarD [Pseudoclavibacter triregionum]